MKLLGKLTLLYFFLPLLITCTSIDIRHFNEIFTLTEQENYFSAQEVYDAYKNNLSVKYQLFIEAVLDNAFNRLSESDRKVEDLLEKGRSLPDSLLLRLWEVKYDNALKLYDYSKAGDAVVYIIENHKNLLSGKELADYKNSLKIWQALKDIPPQEVLIMEPEILTMEKDLAGLNTLQVSSNNDTLDFVFDTGANISTTSRSVADRLNMNMIPVDIEVGTITGAKAEAQLAVCDEMCLGSILLRNVVFLVFPDEGLSFPQINYTIYGILGYPVMEALNEIKITQDGKFIVPVNESAYSGNPNLALSGLTPLIWLNNKHFTFDTGADRTMLYDAYYRENKEEIEKLYQPTSINFGGAGGTIEVEGFIINQTFTINNTEVEIDSIHLLKNKLDEDETVYGNIGQDLITKFDTLTLNFSKMFIKFD